MYMTEDAVDLSYLDCILILNVPFWQGDIFLKHRATWPMCLWTALKTNCSARWYIL
jgi:hypothetical protein